MANFTVQSVTEAGAVPTMNVCNVGGDFIVGARDGLLVWIQNLHTADQTVTLESEVPAGEGYIEQDKAVLVTAASDHRVFRLSSRYIAADGRVALTYSGVTALTMAVLAL